MTGPQARPGAGLPLDVPPLDLPPVDVAADEPFAEPWQARIFATAVLACARLGRPWDDFRDLLKAAVGEDPERPYFESFTLALERLVEAAPGSASPSTSPSTSAPGEP